MSSGATRRGLLFCPVACVAINLLDVGEQTVSVETRDFMVQVVN